MPQTRKARRLVYYNDLRTQHGVRLSRSQVARLEAAGKFPKRVHPSANSIAWFSDEVEAWKAALDRARFDEAEIEQQRVRAASRSGPGYAAMRAKRAAKAGAEASEA